MRGTPPSFCFYAAGNRDSMTVDGVPTDYTYNSLDQLVSTSSPSGTTTYTYDGRGNIDQVTAGSQTTDYTYDAADRLAGVTLPNTIAIAYKYDADRRRIKQTVGSQTTNYLWDENSTYGDVVLETDENGATLASYVLAGTELVSQTRNSSTSYYLQDGQGSTRALTNAAGSITDTYSYTAFGELLSQTGSTANNYLYTGQQFDALTGLYDLRARYYDPAMGRFLSQDTYPVNFGNPVELNRYVYTANDPINKIDPTGQMFAEQAILQATTAAARGALIGAGIGFAQTMLCGGDMFSNLAGGALFGAALGAGWVLCPPAAAVITGTTGILGYYTALNNIINNNGTPLCNLLNLAASLMAITGSVGGLSGGGPAMKPVFAGNNGGGYTFAPATQGVSAIPQILTGLATSSLVYMMSDEDEEYEQYGSREAPPKYKKYLDRLPKSGASMKVQPDEISFKMLGKLHYYGGGVDEFSLYELSNGEVLLVRGGVRAGKIPAGAVRVIAHSHYWAGERPSEPGDYEVLWYFKQKYGQQFSYIVTEYGKVFEYWSTIEI